MPCPQCGRGFGNTIELCPYCSSPRTQRASDDTRVTAAHHPPYAEPAGFWLRVFASLFDSSIISLISLLIVGVTDRVTGFLKPAFENSSLLNVPTTEASAAALGSGAAVIASVIVLLILSLFYFPIFEASRLAATPGKLLLGLRVTAAGGQRISLARSLGRNLGKILSWLTLGVGHLLAGFTVQKQALHDLIADCFVVKGQVAFSGQRLLAAIISVPLAIGVTYLTEGKDGRGRRFHRSTLSHVRNITEVPKRNNPSGLSVGENSQPTPVPFLQYEQRRAKYASQAVAVDGTIGTKKFRATAVEFSDTILTIKQVGKKGALIALEILLPAMPRSGEGFTAGGKGWLEPQVTLVTYELGDAEVKRQKLQLPYTLRVDFGLVDSDSMAGRIDAILQGVPGRMSGSFSLGAK